MDKERVRENLLRWIDTLINDEEEAVCLAVEVILLIGLVVGGIISVALTLLGITVWWVHFLLGVMIMTIVLIIEDEREKGDRFHHPPRA